MQKNVRHSSVRSPTPDRIDGADVWLVRELYAVLGALADDPRNTISRIGGGRVSIPEDQANDLHEFRRCILAKYPELSLMRVAAEIDDILSRRSRGGELFEELFWTNAAFERHDDWRKIRALARAFLIR